jgi:hypothetical protein
VTGVRLSPVLKPVTVACEECGLEMVGDGPSLRLELTSDG